MHKPPEPKPLADLIGGSIGVAFRRQGFASTEIVTHWDDIVGPEVAALAEPVRMQWIRSRDPDESPPATLVLIAIHIYLVRKHGVAPAPGSEVEHGDLPSIGKVDEGAFARGIELKPLGMCLERYVRDAHERQPVARLHAEIEERSGEGALSE